MDQSFGNVGTCIYVYVSALFLIYTCLDVDNVSMINNAGSITEEGPHLSDCEDASSVHAENVGDCSTVVSVGGDQCATTDSSYNNSVTSAIDNKPVPSPRNESVTTLVSQETVESKEALDTNTQNSPPEKDEDVSVATSKITKSIYIDDGDSHSKNAVSKKDTKPKRMTMVCHVHRINSFVYLFTWYSRETLFSSWYMVRIGYLFYFEVMWEEPFKNIILLPDFLEVPNEN